jgi:hypothetical protein
MKLPTVPATTARRELPVPVSPALRVVVIPPPSMAIMLTIESR